MILKLKKQKNKKIKHYKKDDNAALYWIFIMALLFFILIINPIIAGKILSNGGKINSITLRYILWAIVAFLCLLFLILLIFPIKLVAHFKANWPNYILLLIIFLIALIFAEIGLRVISNTTLQKKIYISNYEYNYSISLNSHGFRDNEFIKQKNANAFRIFLIGDSFVYGDGAEQNQTINYYLEQILNEKNNSLDDRGISLRYEVFNLGLSGAGPKGYYDIAKQFASYKPDLIIVMLYVDTDIRRDTSFLPALLRKFKLFNAIENINFNRGKCIYDWIDQYDVDNFYKDLACKGLITPWLLPRGALGDNQLYYDKLTKRFENEDLLRNKLLVIKKLYKDTPFLLVIQPANFQVSTKYFNSLRKVGYVFLQDKIVDAKLQDIITKWASSNGINNLDLLPYLKEGNASYFYPIDGHLVPEGNYLVADKISKAITG